MQQWQPWIREGGAVTIKRAGRRASATRAELGQLAASPNPHDCPLPLAGAGFDDGVDKG